MGYSSRVVSRGPSSTLCLVTRNEGDSVEKKEFIKMVMYGAVFQEGWRALYGPNSG